MGARRPGACLWLATTPGKRWTEIFFLWWSVLWISAMGWIVASGAYESFEEWSYLCVGVAFALPCFVLPPLLPGSQGEPGTPLLQRFWVKANLWLAILSFIGNYFWTHYFYSLLGAAYTFKAHRLNDVPIALMLITHAYFATYHTFTTIALRRFWSGGWYARAGRVARCVSSCALVASLAYFTAFMETWTISSFPYYTIRNRPWMYKVGSVFYGLYFIVSFPMYFRLGEGGDGEEGEEEEEEKEEELRRRQRKAADPAGKAGSSEGARRRQPEFSWTLDRVAIDSLGACMLVTCLLDFWRLFVSPSGHSSTVPFLA